jgi:RimJ/RimL family protein N-acetyltransferase
MADVSWHGVVGDESDWQVRDSQAAIRAAVVDDADALYAVGRLPEVQVFVSQAPHSVKEARDRILKQRADDHAVRCVIEVDQRVVGDIGGRFYRPDSLDEIPNVWDFHLGYSVHPALWGRGIATAAVGLFTTLLHERLGVRRIVAKVFEENRASARVLEKHGFRHEGTEIAAVLGRDRTWLNDSTFAHLA